MRLPRVRFTVRRMMVVVAVAATVLGFVTYRERHLPILDETGGGWDTAIVVAVDIGSVFGVPAVLAMGLLVSFLFWGAGRIERFARRSLRRG